MCVEQEDDGGHLACFFSSSQCWQSVMYRESTQPRRTRDHSAVASCTVSLSPSYAQRRTAAWWLGAAWTARAPSGAPWTLTHSAPAAGAARAIRVAAVSRVAFMPPYMISPIGPVNGDINYFPWAASVSMTNRLPPASRLERWDGSTTYCGTAKNALISSAQRLSGNSNDENGLTLN